MLFTIDQLSLDDPALVAAVLRNRFNPLSVNTDDMRPAARQLAAIAYYRFKDKGTDHPLSQHTDMVKRCVVQVADFFEPHMDRKRRNNLEAKAELHEIFDLRAKVDGESVPIWQKEHLLEANFPLEDVEDLYLMSKRDDQKYHDNIQELAISHDPRIAVPDPVYKKIADLAVNMAPNRILPQNPSEQLLHKKKFVYPQAYQYLLAVARKTVDPRKTSVKEFIMTSPHVQWRLKNDAIFEKYSSDTRTYEKRGSEARSWVQKHTAFMTQRRDPASVFSYA